MKSRPGEHCAASRGQDDQISSHWSARQREIHQRAILVFGGSRAEIEQELRDRVLGRAGCGDGRAQLLPSTSERVAAARRSVESLFILTYLLDGRGTVSR